jgi:hypothetical protein
MDRETISRKQKIELARKMAGKNYYGSGNRRTETFRKTEAFGNEKFGDEKYGRKAGEKGHFFLRILLSIFVLLAVMGVTEFDAMGDGNGEKYQKQLVKILKSQEGVERVKAVIRNDRKYCFRSE